MSKHTWILIALLALFIGGGLLYRHYAQDVDSRGATRLMRAIEENDFEKALKLLDATEVNVRDKAGQTPLFYAAKHATDPKVIYRLIVWGADPLATDEDGHTPLTTAAKYNPSTSVVMALAKQGHKDPRQQGNKNEALAEAVKHNTASVIKTLLIAQASPAAIKNKGRDAATFLAENERLSEQEKALYRQVMLTLEILEEREKFANAMKGGISRPKTAEKSASKSADTPKIKKEQSAPAPVPQERQMSEVTPESK